MSVRLAAAADGISSGGTSSSDATNFFAAPRASLASSEARTCLRFPNSFPFRPDSAGAGSASTGGSAFAGASSFAAAACTAGSGVFFSCKTGAAGSAARSAVLPACFADSGSRISGWKASEERRSCVPASADACFPASPSFPCLSASYAL